MKRQLVIVLASLYLLGPGGASPAFAGSCPSGFWDRCTMECMMQYGVGCVDACYGYDEGGMWYEFGVCNTPGGPWEPNGWCEYYGSLPCSQCC